jgi:phosphoenolpyruvate carboxykinase (GTP)
MLELKKGVDILAHTGGIKSIDEARKIFEEKLDGENLAKLNKIKTEEALLKIANAIALCKPDAVMITTGSPEDKARVRRMSIDKGEEKPLAMPDHTIHFDLPEEQGRIIDRTFTSSTTARKPASWPRQSCATRRWNTSGNTWTAS